MANVHYSNRYQATLTNDVGVGHLHARFDAVADGRGEVFAVCIQQAVIRRADE